MTIKQNKIQPIDKDEMNKDDEKNKRQYQIYLDGFKLNYTSLNSIIRFYEIKFKESNYLRISELNELIKITDLQMMKERLFRIKFIEIDDSISLNKNELIKLSKLIAYSTGLIIRKFDLNAIDYLLKQMPYIKRLQFNNIRIDKMMSNYLMKFQNAFKQLNRLEIVNDKSNLKFDNCIEFLLNCKSLNELSLINVPFKIDDLIRILTRNANCLNVKLLNHLISKEDQQQIVETISYNALISKNFNFNLMFTRKK